MAKTDFRGAMEYAAQNPSSDFARQLKMRIQTGEFDTQAHDTGVDLTPFGRPTVTPVSSETSAPSIRDVTRGTVDRIKEAGGQIKQAFKGGVAKMNEGKTEQQTASNPLHLLEGGLKVAAGGVEAVTSPLAPAFAPIGKGIEKAADKISETKPFKEYGEGLVDSKEKTGAERALENTINATEVAGMFVGPKGAPKVAEAGFNAAKGAADATAESLAQTATGIKTGIKETAKMVKPDALQGILTKPLEKPYENVFKETKAADFDKYVDLGKKAAENFKNQTPMEHAGTRAQEALGTIQKQLSTVGEKKSQLMKSGLGGLTPIKGDILKPFYQKLQSYFNSRTLVEGDKKLFGEVIKQVKELGQTPAAGQIDRFIDFVQDKIYTSGRELTVPVSDSGTAMLRSAVGQLNKALKEQLPDQYKQLNQQYADLIDVRNELNTKLGKEGERGGALMKRVFSPSDNNTKMLFQKVKELTGVDLVNEAAMAKFVMETLGDVRQKSLLEELHLPKTATQTALWGLGKIREVMNSPESMLKRAREMTQGGAPAKVKPDFGNLSAGLAMKDMTSAAFKEAIADNVGKALKEYKMKPMQAAAETMDIEGETRLWELQDISDTRALTRAELMESIALLRKHGIETVPAAEEGSLVQGREANGKFNSEKIPADSKKKVQ